MTPKRKATKDGIGQADRDWGRFPMLEGSNTGCKHGKPFNYPTAWLQPTTTYGGRGGCEVKIPDDIGDFISAYRRLSLADVNGIVSRIRAHKCIPELMFAPKRLRQHMKGRVWWFHPLMVTAERTFSWVAADKDGCYLAYPEDGDVKLVIPWELVDHVGSPDAADFGEGDDAESLVRCHFFFDEEEIKFATLDEFVKPDDGPFLDILYAIYKVYQPVIEASRGRHVWIPGAGGEKYLGFASWDELLDPIAWKRAGSRPDPALYGGVTYTPDTTESTSAEADQEGPRDADDHVDRSCTIVLTYSDGKTELQGPFPNFYEAKLFVIKLINSMTPPQSTPLRRMRADCWRASAEECGAELRGDLLMDAEDSLTCRFRVLPILVPELPGPAEAFDGRLFVDEEDIGLDPVD